MEWLKKIYLRFFERNKQKLIEAPKQIEAEAQLEEEAQPKSAFEQFDDYNLMNAYAFSLKINEGFIESQINNRMHALKNVLDTIKLYMAASNIALYKKSENTGELEKIVNAEKDYEEITDQIISNYIEKSKGKQKEIDMQLDIRKRKKC